MPSAIFDWFLSSFFDKFLNQSSHSLIDFFVTVPIFVLSIFTDKAFSLSLKPLHTLQSLSERYFSNSYWTHHLSVSLYFLSIKFNIPSKLLKFFISFFLSPFKINSWTFLGISFQGVLVLILNCFKILSMVSIKKFFW